MAQGRVKDPDGHHAFPAMGYIQRTDNYTNEPFPDFSPVKGQFPEKKSLNWLDSTTTKVIPFYNSYNPDKNTGRKFQFNGLVEFDLNYSLIKIPKVETEIFLGNATNVRPKQGDERSSEKTEYNPNCKISIISTIQMNTVL